MEIPPSTNTAAAVGHGEGRIEDFGPRRFVPAHGQMAACQALARLSLRIGELIPLCQGERGDRFWRRTVSRAAWQAGDDFSLINEDTVMKGAVWRWKASKGPGSRRRPRTVKKLIRGPIPYSGAKIPCSAKIIPCSVKKIPCSIC
jgi:hypothetical protein